MEQRAVLIRRIIRPLLVVGDGIPDAVEPALGTDPLNPDSDGDGVQDGADPEPFIPNDDDL